MKTKADSYDIIGEAVRKWWDDRFECDVVVFFEQKYDYEEWDDWCKEEVVVEHDGDGGMSFDWDFCEGQTDVRNIYIESLNTILQWYRQKVVNYRFKEEKPNEGNNRI